MVWNWSEPAKTGWQCTKTNWTGLKSEQTVLNRSGLGAIEVEPVNRLKKTKTGLEPGWHGSIWLEGHCSRSLIMIRWAHIRCVRDEACFVYALRRNKGTCGTWARDKDVPITPSAHVGAWKEMPTHGGAWYKWVGRKKLLVVCGN